MFKKQQELFFVEPTIFFYKFLIRQGIAVQKLKKSLMHIDNTAYFIKRQLSNEATISEIEKNYLSIFLYETRRWLGKPFCFNEKPSLCDFANCFSLEFHQNVCLFVNERRHNLFCFKIKPRQSLLKWFNLNTTKENDFKSKFSLVDIQQNSTVVLTKLKKLEDVLGFVTDNFEKFASLENKRLLLSCLPLIKTFDDYKRFFSISIHQYIKFLEPELKNIIAL